MSEMLAMQAISDRRIVTFTYSGRARTVEPHALGYDSDGDLTLCGWQTSGGSGVGFRDFHLRKASAFAITQASFSGPRPGYRRDDQTLSRILAQL